MTRFIRNAATFVGAAVLVIVLGFVMAFITINNVQHYPSFWVGAAGLFGALLAVTAFYWASHKATRQWPGTFLGLATAIVMVVATAVWKPFDHFSWGDFGLGVLALVILAAASGIIFGAAHLYKS